MKGTLTKRLPFNFIHLSKAVTCYKQILVNQCFLYYNEKQKKIYK